VDPSGLVVVIRSRPVQNTLGGGAHTWVEVRTLLVVPTKFGTGLTLTVHTSFSGLQAEDGTLAIVQDYGPDIHATTITSTTVVPTPDGMSQTEWDLAVIDSGHRALSRSGTRDYALMGGDGGNRSGNCHVVTDEILEGAGGDVPSHCNPPGLNPGLHD
jgi:hypothetical protein